MYTDSIITKFQDGGVYRAHAPMVHAWCMPTNAIAERWIIKIHEALVNAWQARRFPACAMRTLIGHELAHVARYYTVGRRNEFEREREERLCTEIGRALASRLAGCELSRAKVWARYEDHLKMERIIKDALRRSRKKYPKAWAEYDARDRELDNAIENRLAAATQ